jgi:hypothetical protein
MFAGYFQLFGSFLAASWWIWTFLLLVPVFSTVWLYWRARIFEETTKNIFLELRMPREVRKSPRAMEQVLMVFHSLRNAPGDIGEKWMDGEYTREFSLEVVSFGGEIHFYVMTYHKYRPLIEAAFFSYYPDIEIVEVDDYISRFPASLKEMYAQGYDLWGTEILLEKEGAYPIRTYEEFESPDEDKQYDPISALIEYLAQVKPEQIVAIQFVITACDPNWKQQFEPLVEELKEKAAGKKAVKKKSAPLNFDFSTGPLPVVAYDVQESIEGGDNLKSLLRSPGETDVLKAVENNLMKPAFETVIRCIYFSPKELYYDSFARRGVLGSFNQYASLGLNAFKGNVKTYTQAKGVIKPYVFPKRRSDLKKQRLLYAYKHRKTAPENMYERIMTSHPLNWNTASKSILLTTQCLATIFHPPTFIVLTGPHMKRVESRKAGPPAGLAIFGAENEIEEYR